MSRFFFIFLLFIATKAEAQTSALAIADSLYAVGNYSEAIAKLEKISGKSDAVRLRMAKFYEAGGNYSAAIDNYSIVVANDPKKILAALAYGKLLMKAGQLQKADTVIERLSKKYPENASFHYQRGLVNEKMKDSSAIKYFRFAAVLDKTHQQAHFKVAKHLLSRGKLAEAEAMSRRGLEAHPQYVSLISILAQSLYHQQKYPEAIEQFEKLVQLGEGSEFVHSKLGTAWEKRREFEKAIEQFNLALGYEDKNFVTHYRLGNLYVYIGDYKKSEQHLLTAILLKDVSLDMEYFSLGLTYKFAKDHKKALDYFSKAIEENSDNERAWYERAIAADSYFKDLETRLNYYQAYLNKYEESGYRELIYLAKRRVKDIREEMHLAAEQKDTVAK